MWRYRILCRRLSAGDFWQAWYWPYVLLLLGGGVIAEATWMLR